MVSSSGWMYYAFCLEIEEDSNYFRDYCKHTVFREYIPSESPNLIGIQLLSVVTAEKVFSANG